MRDSPPEAGRLRIMSRGSARWFPSRFPEEVISGSNVSVCCGVSVSFHHLGRGRDLRRVRASVAS
jgi:hypothetical protein